MNRLILLGNGFDLAHGIKSSYNDFILWYLTNCFKKALANNGYEDSLLTILITSRYQLDSRLASGEVEDFIQDHYRNNTLCNIMGTEEQHSVSFSFISSDDYYRPTPTPPMSIKVSSVLLCHMINNCSIDRWVDIENLFYSTLKKILDSQNLDKQEKVNDLNQSLAFIINELQVYLQGLDKPGKIEDYDGLTLGPIQSEDIIKRPPLTFKDLQDHVPEKVLLLNFNYTDTAKKYLDTSEKISINHIHGQLDSTNNPMIFGFGDELDDEYKKFELDATKQIFKYIKSFWYFKTSNYHNLIRFIQSDKFQVCIMGHSCGLSDRTMLNMIFEHQNCISIKIYFYQNPTTGYNNYTELTEEISRHFTDKRQMRLKIVPLDKSSPMPQKSPF